MTSSVYNVAVGTPVVLPVGQNTSFCVQAGATGTILLEYSNDKQQTWLSAPQGGVAGAYSLCAQTYNLSSISGFVRATATTVAGTIISSNLSQYPNLGVRPDIFQTGVAMVTPNLTTEVIVASVRLPAGFVTPNFNAHFRYNVVMTNGANVKTLKGYFGPTGALGTALYSVPLTSLLNGTGDFICAGANDGQTINGWGIGAAASGGQGFGATALIQTTLQGYQTQEMEFCLTITKATGTDTATLNAAQAFFWR